MVTVLGTRSRSTPTISEGVASESDLGIGEAQTNEEKKVPRSKRLEVFRKDKGNIFFEGERERGQRMKNQKRARGSAAFLNPLPLQRRAQKVRRTHRNHIRDTRAWPGTHAVENSLRCHSAKQPGFTRSHHIRKARIPVSCEVGVQRVPGIIYITRG